MSCIVVMQLIAYFIASSFRNHLQEVMTPFSPTASRKSLPDWPFIVVTGGNRDVAEFECLSDSCGSNTSGRSKRAPYWQTKVTKSSRCGIVCFVCCFVWLLRDNFSNDDACPALAGPHEAMFGHQFDRRAFEIQSPVAISLRYWRGPSEKFEDRGEHGPEIERRGELTIQKDWVTNSISRAAFVMSICAGIANA